MVESKIRLSTAPSTTERRQYVFIDVGAVTITRPWGRY